MLFRIIFMQSRFVLIFFHLTLSRSFKSLKEITFDRNLINFFFFHFNIIKTRHRQLFYTKKLTQDWSLIYFHHFAADLYIRFRLRLIIVTARKREKYFSYFTFIMCEWIFNLQDCCMLWNLLDKRQNYHH
jgi:hypothetical protein